MIPPQTPTHVMIGTPAYGGMVHITYVQALLEYARHGIGYSLVTIGNESLITRARNSLAALFLAQPQFTHLLFLDADVVLPAEGLRQMLAAGKDVMGAPVALKGRDREGARVFNIGCSLGEEGDLFVVERIGTAALLLSRVAVQALAEAAEREGHVYGSMNICPGESAPVVQYDIFRVGVEDGEYLSEDYWVCHALRRLGFQIFLNASIVTRHHGTVEV